MNTTLNQSTKEIEFAKNFLNKLGIVDVEFGGIARYRDTTVFDLRDKNGFYHGFKAEKGHVTTYYLPFISYNA